MRLLLPINKPGGDDDGATATPLGGLFLAGGYWEAAQESQSTYFFDARAEVGHQG